MIYFLLTLNGLLMILAPVLVAWLLRRYRSVSWRLWGIGAAAFILSQVGHIPFNSLVNRLWQPDPQADFIPLVLFLGFSAGVFEEITRYLTFRYWAKEARSWGQGLMVGAGHGGIEAILTGVLFFLSFINLALYQSGQLDAALSTAPAEQVALLDAAAQQMFSLPWYEALLGGVERLFAVILHLSLSLLVLRAVTRKQVVWVAAAITWHALANAGAVYLSQKVGPLAAEGFLALVAILSLAFIFASRTPEPVPSAPAPLPDPTPIVLKPVSLEEARLDESRYQ